MAVADRVCRHCGQRFDPTIATACAAGVRADGDVCEAPTYEKLEAERDRLRALAAEHCWVEEDPGRYTNVVAERDAMRAALQKISDIRDSIIGTQGFHWSEHAYPLVAALDAAGFKGAGYETGRENVSTLIEQRDAAVAERDNMITREAAANRAVNGMRAEAAELETALYSAAEAAGVSVDILTVEIGRLKESERRHVIDRDALLDERDAMRAVIEHARWWRDHPGAPGRKLIDALSRLDALEGGG